MKKNLTSKNLKDELWETLSLVKEKKLPPLVANAIATQSREIMRIIKTELSIMHLHGAKPPKALIEFTTEREEK